MTTEVEAALDKIERLVRHLREPDMMVSPYYENAMDALRVVRTHLVPKRMTDRNADLAAKLDYMADCQGGSGGDEQTLRACADFIRAAYSQSPEPVAWRYKMYPDKGWQYASNLGATAAHAFICEPLYAAPPTTPATTDNGHSPVNEHSAAMLRSSTGTGEPPAPLTPSEREAVERVREYAGSYPDAPDDATVDRAADSDLALTFGDLRTLLGIAEHMRKAYPLLAGDAGIVDDAARFIRAAHSQSPGGEAVTIGGLVLKLFNNFELKRGVWYTIKANIRMAEGDEKPSIHGLTIYAHDDERKRGPFMRELKP